MQHQTSSTTLTFALKQQEKLIERTKQTRRKNDRGVVLQAPIAECRCQMPDADALSTL
jgi:hypothetical protein